MNHEFWYLSRAAGFTAYLLLFVSVALGISIGTRLADRITRRSTVFDLHRFTTLLALGVTLFHVYVLLGDGYFNFDVWQLSVPFLSPYRGWQTAAGVVSLYAMVLIIASFYVRQHIGYRAWRALHFLTFALYAGATLHGITAGTDTTQPWARLLYVLTGAATVSLILYRVQYRVPDSATVRALRLASGAATGVTAAALIFGTGLLGRATSTASSSDALAAAAAPQGSNEQPTSGEQYPFLASFDSDFSGSYTQTRDNNRMSLTLDGATTGDLNAKVHVELVQAVSAPRPDDEESEHQADDEEAEARPRASVVVNKAQIVDAGSGAVLCDGQLTTLDGGYMRFTCEGSGPYSGVEMTVASRLRATRDGSVSGPLSGQMQRHS